MSLQSLVGMSLEQITPAKETAKRLLDGAARHIAGAQVLAISAETRFASAYTAIRMPADVGPRAAFPAIVSPAKWLGHTCDRSGRPWWSDHGRDVMR
ncbi:MAG: hypothetical protein ACYDAE_13680 [Steroidobacteraceae bacterium]